MDKSYVSMEQGVCIVCNKQYNTDTILMDRSMRNSMNPETLTHVGICPEHQEVIDDGYIILIGVDAEKSRITMGTETVKPEDAWRTGNNAYIKREAWEHAVDIPVPADGIAYVENEVIMMLNDMNDEAENHKELLNDGEQTNGNTEPDPT